MNAYFHSKSVLAFQLAQGDMFRAQEHLLTSSELRDTDPRVGKVFKTSEIPLFGIVVNFIDFTEIGYKLRLQIGASQISDGVRMSSWALNMSP